MAEELATGLNGEVQMMDSDRSVLTVNEVELQPLQKPLCEMDELSGNATNFCPCTTSTLYPSDLSCVAL